MRRRALRALGALARGGPPAPAPAPRLAPSAAPAPPARRAFCADAAAAAQQEPLLSDMDRLRMSMDLQAIKRNQVPAHLGVQRAPMLIPFCHVGGRASVLFTLRGGADGLIAPDVGFPGCRPEASPASPADAAVRQASAELGLPKERFDVLGLHHDVPDARTRVVLTPVLAYLGELQASSLRFRGGAGARGAFSLSLESLLSADSLAFEPDLHGTQGGPPAPVFNRAGGDRRITGAAAAALHAALRVALGRRGGAQRDALYAPLLAAMSPRREQRG